MDYKTTVEKENWPGWIVTFKKLAKMVRQSTGYTKYYFRQMVSENWYISYKTYT